MESEAFPMRQVPRLIASACLAAAFAGPGMAGDIAPADGRGLAPYRFNPAPDSLTPAQEGIAEAYRSRLRSQRLQLEPREFRSGPLEQEQLRGLRRELGRVDRLLDRQ